MLLDTPLSSYATHDEFQVGRILVFIEYAPDQDRSIRKIEVEGCLPSLKADIPTVEQLVTTHVTSSVMATVIGIHIGATGLASFDCTFFDGDYEDQFYCVSKASNGQFLVEAS